VIKETWNTFVEYIAYSFINGAAPKRNYNESFLSQVPGFYGAWYLISIPLFAFVYWLPIFEFCSDGKQVKELSSFLYFSAVTVTTLGYGDITPENLPAMLLSGSHSVIGVGLIGLFLNSLSHQTAKESQKEEREEIANVINRRTDELIGEVTGGDSFPRVMVLPPFKKGTGSAKVSFICEGRYPLQSVVVHMNDEFTGKELLYKEVGTLLSSIGKPGDEFIIEFEGQISIQAHFHSRNGYWIQNIRLELIRGKWRKAEEVVLMRDNIEGLINRNVIFREVDSFFPSNLDDSVGWGEDFYCKVSN
jgi:hypothetical protein